MEGRGVVRGERTAAHLGAQIRFEDDAGFRHNKIARLPNGPAPGPAMLSRLDSIRTTPWRF